MANQKRTHKDLLKFWTDPSNKDIILNAEALDVRLKIGDDGMSEPSRQLQPTSSKGKARRIKNVDDKDLTEYPYQSVGRLFWWKKSHMDDLVWVTAFYIGNNKIMTAAHALDDEDLQSKFGIFVPAMVNEEDYKGENYGSFIVDPSTCVQHPDYKPYKSCYDNNEPITPQYDICTMEVGEGCFQSWNNPIESIDQVEALKPIRLEGNNVRSPDTTWVALGYPYLGGKMMKVTGSCVTEKSDDLQVAIDIEFLQGMSGGPWFSGNSLGADSIANGCSAAACSYNSISPYFSDKLFDIFN